MQQEGIPRSTATRSLRKSDKSCEWPTMEIQPLPDDYHAWSPIYLSLKQMLTKGDLCKTLITKQARWSTTKWYQWVKILPRHNHSQIGNERKQQCETVSNEEREREKERERERERQTDRQTDRQRQTETETDRRNRETHTHSHRDRATDKRHSDRDKERETEWERQCTSNKRNKKS